MYNNTESDASSLTRRRALTGLGAAAAVGAAATLLPTTAEAKTKQPADARSFASAARFYSVTPTRLIDTRVEGGRMTRAQVRLGNWFSTSDSNYAGLLANVTVVGTTKAGYLTFYAADQTRPTVSDINWWGSGFNLSNQIYIPTGSAGGVETSFRYYLFGESGVSTHVLVDLKGFFYNV